MKNTLNIKMKADASFQCRLENIDILNNISIEAASFYS